MNKSKNEWIKGTIIIILIILAIIIDEIEWLWGIAIGICFSLWIDWLIHISHKIGGKE